MSSQDKPPWRNELSDRQNAPTPARKSVKTMEQRSWMAAAGMKKFTLQRQTTEQGEGERINRKNGLEISSIQMCAARQGRGAAAICEQHDGKVAGFGGTTVLSRNHTEKCGQQSKVLTWPSTSSQRTLTSS
jgi:hypothetical protein